jgi:DNA-binding HxlR family transcriptional regulator
MLGRTYDQQVCSIARALEVVGERWTLLIVRDALFAHVTRFNDFKHNLGLATNVLKTRLDSLVAAGLMERHSSTSRDRSDYLLTEKGRDLALALMALTSWGDRWASPAGPPILYQHSHCGDAVGPALLCATCGEVPNSEVDVRPGPGMPAEYLAARRPRRQPQQVPGSGDLAAARG